VELRNSIFLVRYSAVQKVKTNSPNTVRFRTPS
jgi:hypothetical protein